MEGMVRSGVEGEGMRTLSETLMAGGYEMDNGGRWKLLNALPAIMTVHTSVECSVTEGGSNSLAFRDAVELPVMNGDSEMSLEHGFKTFVSVNGHNGVSLGVQNMRRNDVYVLVDVDGSEGTISHRGTSRAEEKMKPGEFKVMHHLTPERQDEDWNWTYSVAISEGAGRGGKAS